MPQTLMTWVAFGIAVYLAYITLRRILGDSDDPNASVAASSDTGSFSFLLSGSWYVAALAAVLAGLMWPLPKEDPRVAIILVGLVAAHWVIERRERI